MDRSYLTTDPVIKASHDFVCIRLATYEDKEEGEYLKSLDAGKSDQLENTAFCFLDPNGKKLSRAGRGARHLFRNADDMASYMKRLAADYQVKDSATPILPKLKDVRLALNVAQCDGQPLVVAFGSEKALSEIDLPLAQAAFSERLRGRFVFAATTDETELIEIGLKRSGDSPLQPGVYAVAPDKFGLKGIELARMPLDSSLDQIVEQLGAVAKTQKSGAKSHHRQHVQSGNRAGAKWETEIPVTDPLSVKTMERRESRGRKR